MADDVIITEYDRDKFARRLWAMSDYNQCNISQWEDIVTVSAGAYHTIGLRADGTVVATGNNKNGQCNVKSWENIVDIATGTAYSVGLKTDGTVVSVGTNEDNRSDVSKWKDIVAISAGDAHTVGLKADGTVVATGYCRTLIARIEHFAVGDHEEIYDFDTVNKLAAEHLVFLYHKLVPIINAARESSTRGSAYVEFETLTQRLILTHPELGKRLPKAED
ncbi:MAG: hypothetical protein J5927_01065 [Oscillospiraceae bacterium]|nr:hypothetical protein [Oscillospiraceae bacterium]